MAACEAYVYGYEPAATEYPDTELAMDAPPTAPSLSAAVDGSGAQGSAVVSGPALKLVATHVCMGPIWQC